MAAACENRLSVRDRLTASRRVGTPLGVTGVSGGCGAGTADLPPVAGPKESLLVVPTVWRTKTDWAISGHLESSRRDDPRAHFKKIKENLDRSKNNEKI